MMIEKLVEQSCIVGAVGSSVMGSLITEYPSTRSTTLHLVKVIMLSMYTWIMYGIQTILQKNMGAVGLSQDVLHAVTSFR